MYTASEDRQVQIDYGSGTVPHTGHALGRLAGSRRTLLHMDQQAAGGRHNRQLESIYAA